MAEYGYRRLPFFLPVLYTSVRSVTGLRGAAADCDLAMVSRSLLSDGIKIWVGLSSLLGCSWEAEPVITTNRTSRRFLE
jgi:hypothetical protein